ncbi:hypothetical protein SPF06_00830 [Sinomonas sp. JGH33]|uniref:DUF7572 domain-containing protein n=1 Tax=Sinomonas terricola TaxID=3110330 RepID=A0ABU5T187_9MICC|nr:hypothetical protein [Sinomonas sp. JGH33]MEA5453254.1 hypothetical protein [Sinomonas sp. JGH33]
MPTATHIRNLHDWIGRAALYRMDPPLDGNEYVVVSAADSRGRRWASTIPEVMKTETYIFGADDEGNCPDLRELPGSMKGTLSHEEALAKAGYEVAW